MYVHAVCNVENPKMQNTEYSVCHIWKTCICPQFKTVIHNFSNKSYQHVFSQILLLGISPQAHHTEMTTNAQQICLLSGLPALNPAWISCELFTVWKRIECPIFIPRNKLQRWEYESQFWKQDSSRSLLQNKGNRMMKQPGLGWTVFWRLNITLKLSLMRPCLLWMWREIKPMGATQKALLDFW